MAPPKKDGKKVKRSTKAGLTFPVSIMRRFLGEQRVAERIGRDSALYLTAIAEYLVTHILERAGNAARDLNETSIEPRQIELALRDEELRKLLGRVVLPDRG